MVNYRDICGSSSKYRFFTSTTWPYAQSAWIARYVVSRDCLHSTMRSLHSTRYSFVTPTRWWCRNNRQRRPSRTPSKWKISVCSRRIVCDTDRLRYREQTFSRGVEQNADANSLWEIWSTIDDDSYNEQFLPDDRYVVTQCIVRLADPATQVLVTRVSPKDCQ
jgi:hypothetical protein